jgi:aldose 1-epimerase
MFENKEIRLRNDKFELRLAPEIGGSIAAFDHIAGDGVRTPILRPSDKEGSGVLDMASFPLVPFCNRIRGGRFTFQGSEVRLAANMAGDPSPLHGQGWLAVWQVEQADETTAELTFRHTPGEWPWAYEARQRFQLDRDGLAISLSCRNLGDEPMPCGLGLHPYFLCTPSTVLDTGVTDVWTVDEKVLPVERVPAAGRYGLRDRLICGQGLDNGYAGWSGEATIRTPEVSFVIRMTSADAGYFQVYSPVQGGIFAAEPVGHANAALNEPEERWSALGIEVLQAGQTLSLNARIDATLE